MIIILDEQLDSEDFAVSKALNVLSVPRYACLFRSMREDASGKDDPDIPQYCRDEQIDMLVSANVRDFAAKRELFRRLLESGVSVAVVREPKQSLTAERQLAILATHLRRMTRRLRDGALPVLLILTATAMRERTLAELVEEDEARSKKQNQS